MSPGPFLGQAWVGCIWLRSFVRWEVGREGGEWWSVGVHQPQPGTWRERESVGWTKTERYNRSPLPLLVWVDQSPATFLLDMKTDNLSASSYKEREKSCSALVGVVKTSRQLARTDNEICLAGLAGEMFVNCKLS